jgi:hypothetical protein
MLGLSESTAEYIRFKPSLNQWLVDGEEIDLKGLLIDPSSLKTGWGKISEGAAPEWQWDERPGVKGHQPDPEYKRGFSVMVYLSAHGWREWTTTGSGPKMGLEAVWPAIHNGASSNEGKVAKVKYNGAVAQAIGKGQTRVPQFELVGWADRPEGETAAPAPAAAPTPAPEPAPAPAASSSDGDWEF